MSAESFRSALVVNDPQFSRNRIASAPGENLTVFRHAPLHVIVHDHGNRQVVPDSGIKLGEIQSDRTVANNAYDLPMQMGDLCCKCERKADAETSQIAMAEEAARITRHKCISDPRGGFNTVSRHDLVGLQRLELLDGRYAR